MAEMLPEYTSLNSRITTLEKEITTLRSDTHSTTEKLRTEVEFLKLDSAKHQIKYETILEKLDTLSDKFENMQSKPGKRWETIIDKIIWFIVEATLVVVAVKVGLK